MSKYWSETVRNLKPYVPGEQPRDRDFIKLNTNECPFPPSPRVAAAIREFSSDGLRLYPDPNSSALKESLAKTYEVAANQVFVGNGSDEVLAFAFKTFFDQAAPILFPDITYSFYTVYCDLFDIEYEAIALNDAYEIDLDDYRRSNGGIIFANPNAPTGIELSRAQIEALAQDNTESVIIVDEAYTDFGTESAVELINKYPNLLVIQTFSKSRSLAGIRLGYAFGDSDLIAGLERVKNSFNCYPIDSLASACAIAALEDREYFEATCSKIIDIRSWLTEILTQRGFRVLPSNTNFLLASHPDIPAAQLYASLKQQGVLVRYFNKPRIDNFIRITIGTREEVEQLVALLPEPPAP